MRAEESETTFAKARAAYFQDADKVLQKIHQKYGSDKEGFLSFLNREPLEKTSGNKTTRLYPPEEI